MMIRHLGNWFVFALYAIAAYAPSSHTGLGAELEEVTTNSVDMQLKLIPAGEFVMGCSKEDVDWVVQHWPYTQPGWVETALPPHQVRITKPFYLGIHEVTVGQFRKFAQETNYKTEAEKDGRGSTGWNEEQGKFTSPEPQYNWKNSGWIQSDEVPVGNVTWNDAMAFCSWLSESEGRNYRLPTEAEWEYACRAGATTRYYFGEAPEELSQFANIADETADEKWKVNTLVVSRDHFAFTSPVGRFKPNAFGLYDMHGNVWEWCQDWFERYDDSPIDDPQGPSQGSKRVSRGGSFIHNAGYCRSAYRNPHSPSFRRYYLGFRVALDPSGD